MGLKNKLKKKNKNNKTKKGFVILDKKRNKFIDKFKKINSEFFSKNNK